jgi:hypothetical protein
VDHIDAALAERRFAAWLEGQPGEIPIDAHIVCWPNEEGDYPPDARYDDATEGAVDVGAFLLGDGHESFGEVTIDTATGAVLGVRFEP